MCLSSVKLSCVITGEVLQICAAKRARSLYSSGVGGFVFSRILLNKGGKLLI
jgi:hypothetical protein